jgi:phage shock protein PspC (stress-responsive transcriptional regulator)
MSQQQLMRSETDKKIAGVCGGLGEYLNIDPTWVRLAFVLLAFASGIGLVLYAVLAILMPSASHDVAARIVFDEKMPDDPAALKHSAGEATTSNGSALAGVLLIGFGALFLMGLFGWIGQGLFWPAVLILVGAFFIMRRNR